MIMIAGLLARLARTELRSRTARSIEAITAYR
jgi:hypothetical protein